MNDKRLTEQEKEFATRWHGLIYTFLNKNRLPEAEYYDVAALGYLRAVMKYNRRPELRQYSFSTIAWQTMRTDVGRKMKSDRVRDALIAYSLNELTEEGSERGEFIRDAKDGFMELVQREDIRGLMQQIMPALTDRQQAHLIAMLEGYKIQEILKQQRKSVHDYYRDIEKIREVVLSVVSCSAFRGGGELHKWIDWIFGRTSKGMTENIKCVLPEMSAGCIQAARQGL